MRCDNKSTTLSAGVTITMSKAEKHTYCSDESLKTHQTQYDLFTECTDVSQQRKGGQGAAELGSHG